MPIFDASVLSPVYDTCEIMAIYLQRPAHIATMPFCVWFANAHGLKNPTFRNCSSQQETKLAIISLGYNSLPLNPLFLYNKTAKQLNN